MKTYEMKFEESVEESVVKQTNVETCEECEEEIVETFYSYCSKCNKEIAVGSISFDNRCCICCKTRIKWICEKCLKSKIQN